MFAKQHGITARILGEGPPHPPPCAVWKFSTSKCLRLATSFFNLHNVSAVGNTLEMANACVQLGYEYKS